MSKTRANHVDDDFISSLKKSVKNNDSNYLDDGSIYPLFVDKYGCIEKLYDENNAVAWGRRGSGKTHLLKAFCDHINNSAGNKSIAIYISCLNLKLASPQIILDKKQEVKHYAQSNYVGFIDKFVDKFHRNYDFWVERKFQNDSVDKQKKAAAKQNTFSRIEALYDLVMDKTDYITEITKKTTKKTGDTSSETVEVASKFSAGIKNLIPLITTEVSPNRESTKTEDGELSEEEAYTIEKTLNFSSIRDSIIELTKTMLFDRIYICIDELWLIDRGPVSTIQPLFLEYMKRTFFHNKRITLKFASIRETTNLSAKLDVGNNYGVQINHDIFEAFNFDALRLNQRSRFDEFIEILTERINFFGNSDYKTSDIIKIIFRNRKNYATIVELSAGMPRNFFNILKLSLELIRYKVKKQSINSKLLIDIAIKKHDVSDRAEVSLVSDSIYKAVNTYMSRTSSNFFLIENTQFNRFYMDVNSLVFNEILHRIPSDMTPMVIKNDYKAFLVEGGFYLSVIRSINRDNYESIHNKFQHKIPDNLENSFSAFILDLSKHISNSIQCDLCSTRVSPHHPIYLKHKECPECANDLS